jgi:hypothetical protein
MSDMVHVAALASWPRRIRGLKPEYRSQPGRLRRPDRGPNARERIQTTVQSVYLNQRLFKRVEPSLCCDDQLNLGCSSES